MRRLCSALRSRQGVILPFEVDGVHASYVGVVVELNDAVVG